MSQIKTARTSGVAPHIPVIEPLSISENGTYTAPEGVDGYSPVTVDVPNTYTASDEGKVVSSGALVAQTTRTVTENGTYDTTTNNNVVVDVQEQPWEPLEDGYSNFWFELTDDTLSPWLNFSAKTENAVIDWGDGSGEVALDTLTPTHTYSKAGKYVVKVKGVTGMGAHLSAPYTDRYVYSLQNVELNSEVIALGTYAFANELGLKNFICDTVSLDGGVFYCSSLQSFKCTESNSFPSATFQFCFALSDVTLSGATSIGGSALAYCRTLNEVIIPSSVSTIGTSTFAYSRSLLRVHCQATTPPVLDGSNHFIGVDSSYIIYVPVGTGDTYKAAAGWSTYADHIVEEGQTLSKAALRRIQAEEKNEGDDVR